MTLFRRFLRNSIFDIFVARLPSTCRIRYNLTIFLFFTKKFINSLFKKMSRERIVNPKNYSQNFSKAGELLQTVARSLDK